MEKDEPTSFNLVAVFSHTQKLRMLPCNISILQLYIEW